MHYSIVNEGIITQIEFDKEINHNHNKASNNKRLYSDQNVKAIICKQQSHGDGDS
jgi:hypothetical protein